MNKILVCNEDSLLAIRISRLLIDKNQAFEIIKHPITREELFKYSLIIIHSSYKLTGIFPFIENIVLHSKLNVIYISMNAISSFSNKLNQQPNFVFIDELKMDVELPITIKMFMKKQEENQYLIEENRKLKNQLETEKIISKCKRVLISHHMTEDQAHKYILKVAMDKQISKYDACLFIIKNNLYENID